MTPRGTSVRPARRRTVLAVLAMTYLVLVADRYAAAGMYTWVDDQGDRHLVDSREKVPPKYRARAREVSPDDSRNPAQSSRDPRAGEGAGSAKPAGPRDRPDLRRDDSPRASEGAPAANSGWLDRARARWVTGFPTRTSVAAQVTRWAEDVPRVVAVVLSLAMLFRAAAALGALRAARGLAVFGSSYRAYLARRDGRAEPAQLGDLENRLPTVHRWCRAARLGVTTIGASREVGMGRVMDEGRVDVLRACLTRPELVGQHTLAVLARAEGVHRHRARRPLSLLGCLEILAFWPQYVVWRSSNDPPGGVRVLLSLYWLVVLGWVVVG